MVTGLLKDELRARGEEVSDALCEHFDLSRQELFDVIAVHGYRHFDDIPSLVLTLIAEVGAELVEVGEAWAQTEHTTPEEARRAPRRLQQREALEEVRERRARARDPRVVLDLLRVELPLERLQHAPLRVGQLHEVGVEHLARLLRPVARLHA